ncbi:anaerobic ribonucleoside-triphosphate reductase [Marichromatium purpuratum]|uniref:anaerobic ribonucleoside-triphosphate reductase n=1 Tax=Marichromatium purpuratum TaxID=37487 RepID=UPI0006861B6C|nr:anaerobic ribonucleoside-triphosphate reductase [Marichromatium purpuratum]
MVPHDCAGCAAYRPAFRTEERTRCEVWTRVMGYHRPISHFNGGKRAEHAQRRYFKEASHVRRKA